MSTSNVMALNNSDLVRLVLRRLWRNYDAQGISMRRSLRGALLEGYLDMSPLTVEDPDSYQLDDLWDEIRHRVRKKNNDGVQLLLEGWGLEILKILSDTELGILFLRALGKWYDHDAATSKLPLYHERERLALVLRLIPEVGIKTPISNTDLLLELSDRWTKRTEADGEG